jgi:hypothetical protein
VGSEELRAIVERARTGALSADDHALLSAAVDTLTTLTQELEAADVTIGRLRKLIFGSSSEKTRDVLGKKDKKGETETEEPPAAEPDGAAPAEVGGDETSPEPEAPTSAGSGDDKPKGHGRLGADAYTGAERIRCPHGVLTHGDRCPECEKGKVYRQKQPAVLVRVKGVAPLDATVYELERLRCNLCGKVFTADPPEGVGNDKYDETAAAMLAMLKYGCGMPFFRLERLGNDLGIPMPSSTQWDIVHEAGKAVEPAWDELVRQAADGSVLHNDDTTARILNLGLSETLAAGEPDADRSGVFTSGVVSVVDGREIILFFTGRRHAGENLQRVLAQRSAGLDTPIQMCDALSRNTSPEFDALVAHCLAHARRNFVDLVDHFPDEVAHILETLGAVYHHDAEARWSGMSPEDRLRHHQQHSAEPMNALKTWAQEQFDERRVEPNSTLGKAIRYLQKYWDKLTLFLTVASAPLDNNLCERILKRAILHRKNSLFYKTPNGAQIGDRFMSLITTAELCGANPFLYLVALQRHPGAVEANPGAWMPWNYTEALQAVEGSATEAPTEPAPR